MVEGVDSEKVGCRQLLMALTSHQGKLPVPWQSLRPLLVGTPATLGTRPATLPAAVSSASRSLECPAPPLHPVCLDVNCYGGALPSHALKV